MQIGLLYQYTSEPWGGINAFFRNFAKHLSSQPRWSLASDLISADIILGAGHYRGPAQLLETKHLRNIRAARPVSHPFGLVHSCPAKAVVFRLDGIRSIYSGAEAASDRLLFRNLSFSDAVVFQSEFCRSSFDRMDVAYPAKSTTIINGADPDIFSPSPHASPLSDDLNVVTSSWSTNHKKGFELMSRLSEQSGVTVTHVGRWPEDIPTRGVSLLGEQIESQIAQHLRAAHFLFFPAVDEACSNTVVESLASGVPVIYMKSGGTAEIVGPAHGLSFDNADFGDTASIRRLLERARDSYDEVVRTLRGSVSDYHFGATCRRYCEYLEEVLTLTDGGC